MVAPKRRRAFLIALSVGIVLLTAVYVVVSDRTLWGAWITIAPSWLVAMVLIPSVLRLKSWLAAALLAVFVTVTTEWPRFGNPPEVSSETIRLVSWNIGAGNTGWARALEPLDPDIVLVQESSRPAVLWDGFTWTGTPDPGTLTHFPVTILPTEKVGPWIEPQLLTVEAGGKTILIAHVRLMLPSAVIQLVNPFGERPLENYQARTAQYTKLAALVASTAETMDPDAIIIAGDFNVPARMQSLAPLRTAFRDAWHVAGSGWGATVPEFFPFTRIDHIWVSGDVDVVSVRVHRLDGSDHRAVVMDFELD